MTKKKVNWKTYVLLFEKNTTGKIFKLSKLNAIDLEIDNLTLNIKFTKKNASYFNNQPDHKTLLPPDILLKIETKRILRTYWQRTRDPAIKRLFNAQIVYVRKLLKSFDKQHGTSLLLR